MSPFVRTVLFASTALGLAPQAALAQAQATDPVGAPTGQGTPADDRAAGTGLRAGTGDIIVTARRRAETVQDVPLAISVIGGERAANTGAYNVNRLTQLQPSLQFYSTNPRNSAANIRGLGSPFGLTNDGIEQGVGIYVDQVYYARIASATFDFTDTDRIEILRGPQGTLYGKNTTAGAINVYTKKPSFTPEASVELTGGNYRFFQGKGSVSGPLSDTLALRLSTSITTRRGTIYDTTLDKHENSQDNQSVRGQLLWKPSDKFDMTLYGDYNHQNPNCCVQYYVRTGTTQRLLSRQYAALTAAVGYQVPSTDVFDRVTDLDVDPKAKQEIGGGSVVANLNLAGATITSVTAYRFWHWTPNSDRDFIGLPITTTSANFSTQHQVSQELRIASNGTRKIDYVAGLFGFYQRIDVNDGLQMQGSAASRYLLSPPSGGCTPTSTADACNPAVLNGLTQTLNSSLKNTSAAAFGKLTWHVTSAISIAPGIRVNYDKKKAVYDAVVTTGAGGVLSCDPTSQKVTVVKDQCGVLSPQFYTPDLHKWNVSGDITLAWKVAPTINTYATYARSYKSPGVNLSGVPLDVNNLPIVAAATVKPEKVNHYEVGLKTQLFDRKATVNVAGFWTEINDYQATVNNGQLGVLRGYLANAGKVRTRGVEVDSAFSPTTRLNFYANGAYTDAKYVKFTDAPCPPELSGGTAADATHPASPAGQGGTSAQPSYSPASCDISGQVLPGVSKWAASWGAEYDVPVTFRGSDAQVYVGYDASFRSRFSSNPSPSAYTYIDSYSLHNFRIGIKASGKFDVFAWLRNAFDKNYLEVLTTQSGNTGLVVGQPGDPRTYGGTVRLSF